VIRTLKGTLKDALKLVRRGSSGVDFRESANKRDRTDRTEGVTDPHHRETIGKLCDEMWEVITLKIDALVEITDGFPELELNDRGRDTWVGWRQSEDSEIRISAAY
jgi:hypothetical protein